MKRIFLLVMAAVFLIGTGWCAYAAYRAHRKLVTLNVHNADVRVVVRSIEWQTWEKIIVHRDVSGQVTLNVHDMPLNEVLGIISEQTSARWTAIYPLFSTGKSLGALYKVVAGDVATEKNGWSAFQSRSFQFGGGMFGANVRAQNELVTTNISNKDVGVASLALARFAQARVVAEDGTTGTVRLNLSRVTMPRAVSQLAKQVKRRWTRFYALQPGRRFGTARDETASAPSSLDQTRTREEWQNQFEAQLETMTPEERERALQMRQRWQEMRQLSPEERQKRLAEMAANPEFQRRMQGRMLQRLKNSTPEQRLARDQRIAARRRQQGQR